MEAGGSAASAARGPAAGPGTDAGPGTYAGPGTDAAVAASPGTVAPVASVSSVAAPVAALLRRVLGDVLAVAHAVQLAVRGHLPEGPGAAEVGVVERHVPGGARGVRAVHLAGAVQAAGL